MDLQTTFYIVAIIFMGVMFILLLAVAVAVFVIRAKISAIHRHIDQRLQSVSRLVDAGSDIVHHFTGKKS